MVDIRVGGLARLSSCDWPGELVATVFCQGCPWACGYCHNPHLIPAIGDTEIPWRSVTDFLAGRRGLLDGVVFSGGEPTLQPGLPDAIREVRNMGFRIGLHTGGAYPRRLAAVLPLVDWVGFDIKAPRVRYGEITKVPGSGEKAMKSLRLLLESGVNHDVRTTVHPRLLDEETLALLDAELVAAGAGPTRRQEFRPDGCTDPDLLDPTDR